MLVKCIFWLMALTASVNEIFTLELAATVEPSSLSDRAAVVNISTNPCKDFYRYSCDNWIKNNKKPRYEPIWNPWIAVSHQIKHRLRRILKTHNPTLIKPQLYYRSCLNVVKYETKYLAQLISLVDNFGGWPLITGESWKTADYGWLEVVAKQTRLLNIHPLLKIHFDLDYENPTRYIIYVEPGDLIFPKYLLTNANHASEIKIYEKWILDSVMHIYGNFVRTFEKNEIRDIVEFEMRLATIMETKQQNERTTINKLYNYFPGEWLAVFKIIFGNFTDIKPNTTIAIRNFMYLQNMFLLIRKTGRKVVENYLIWHIIKDLSRDTTRYMRKLNFLIDHAILGVQEDLSREHECLDQVIQYFGSLLLPHYLKLYTNPVVFKKVTAMTDSIKEEFINILMNNQWLSEEAKHLSVGKVKHIKLHLAYPPDRFNTLDTENYYHKLLITNDHFKNVVKMKNFKMTLRLNQLGKKVTVLWPSSPFDVNAFYSVLQNAVFIPLGLLDLPFFHYDRDEIFNYGSLGSLIGHEISHALDPSGILADESGKIRKWFPESDLTTYKNHISCFGTDNSIGENIADANGVRISLGAYKKKHQVSKHVNIYYFFTSFAQTWCEISENTDIFNEDEHAHVSYRVQSLNNIKQFRETFNCAPITSCQLW